MLKGFDWRISAAIAAMTIIILNTASKSGVDTAPIWALLVGGTATAGMSFLLRMRAASRSGAR